MAVWYESFVYAVSFPKANNQCPRHSYCDLNSPEVRCQLKASSKELRADTNLENPGNSSFVTNYSAHLRYDIYSNKSQWRALIIIKQIRTLKRFEFSTLKPTSKVYKARVI